MNAGDHVVVSSINYYFAWGHFQDYRSGPGECVGVQVGGSISKASVLVCTATVGLEYWHEFDQRV